MVRATILLVVCGGLCGCGTTRVESSRRSPSFAGPGLSKVLVIGMANRSEVRRVYEDALVSQLGAAGASGVASYTVLPDSQLRDQAAIDAAVAKSGADGVLVTRCVKTERRDVVIPPSPRMQEYIDTAWPGTYTPEVAGQIDVVTLETRLFDGATRQPAWSGTTQTFDAQDLPRAVSDLSRTIVKQLVKQGLIRNKGTG